MSDLRQAAIGLRHLGPRGALSVLVPELRRRRRLTRVPSGALHLTGLHVDREHRGHGVGTALLEHAEGLASRSGHRLVSARATSSAAARLRGRHGFTPVSPLPPAGDGLMVRRLSTSGAPTSGVSAWDRIAAERDRLPAGWRRHCWRVHIDLVRRWVGEPGGRWLKTDLAEELSRVRALLPALGGSWVGVDISPEVVRRARARVPVAMVGDVRRLPLPDASFDGVLSTSTLDHFGSVCDIDASLRELRRVLRPGGTLVLTMDNGDHPLVRLRNALPRSLQSASGLVPYPVGPTFTMTSGRDALERAGFDVERVEHLLHVPHIIGTRLARLRMVEERVLPLIDRLGRTSAGRYTGHFVAFCCTAR